MFYEFVRHLQTDRTPFWLGRRDPAPRQGDASLHRAVCAEDPELYALCALLPRVAREQHARILYRLLRESRLGMSQDARQLLDGLIGWLQEELDPATVLQVFLGLRRVRANHGHTARAILRYTGRHPEVAFRRRAVREILEHAVGRNTLRGRVRPLPAPPSMDVRPAAPVRLKEEPPHTVTATNRGEVAAILVHRYRGARDPVLVGELEAAVERAAGAAPGYTGAVALVLDLSASTRGYGEREFACLAQSVALTMVLERCFTALRVFPVGGCPLAGAGKGEPPGACGATDLAQGVLDALETGPELVAVVSDGYENRVAGDLSRLVRALPAAGVETPVVFCPCQFSPSDSLEYRRPAPDLPELGFWHQDDFEPLGFFLLAHLPQARTALKAALRGRWNSLTGGCPADLTKEVTYHAGHDSKVPAHAAG